MTKPVTPATPAVAVENVSVTLSGRRVLTDANLTVDSGEFVGLLGPNGAGKTTLMRAILGLVPSTGTVTTSGYIGYVPQRHEVEWNFPISVEDAVLNGRTGIIGWLRRPSKEDRDAVAQALEHVGLTDLRKRTIAELSGGQRQRVIIARALATNPSALLLDEPFTGLDAPNADILLRLFTDLAAAGTAIVMSTHNLAEAVHTCPRLILINGAHTPAVIANAPSSQLLTDPQPWVTTFGVDATSPLLRSIGINQEVPC